MPILERLFLSSGAACYGQMAALLARSTLIITDSGGLQEEGAALNVPVAVVRNVTERPEGLNSGILELVGTDPQEAYLRLSNLLADKEKLHRMSKAQNPYGDGLLGADRTKNGVAIQARRKTDRMASQKYNRLWHNK